MRNWVVAGGLITDDRGLLLVANRRRNGSIDWSTPGGVVDEGETVLGALTREVEEETGLFVAEWSRLCWTTEVEFPDLEMHLAVEVHLAFGRGRAGLGVALGAGPAGMAHRVQRPRAA